MTVLALDLIVWLAPPDHDETMTQIVDKALDHEAILGHRMVRDYGLVRGDAKVRVAALVDTNILDHGDDPDAVVEGIFTNHIDVNQWSWGPMESKDLLESGVSHTQVKAALDDLEEAMENEESEEDPDDDDDEEETDDDE